MKKALVNPNLTASYISEWSHDTQSETYTPVYSVYANSQLIEDVQDTSFEAASPLYWLDCNDNVVTYRWYLDTSDNQIKEIVDVPYPGPVPTQITTNIETI
jgi:hypothetical protein